jgi:hypothetical protein
MDSGLSAGNSSQYVGGFGGPDERLWILVLLIQVAADEDAPGNCLGGRK